MNLPPTALQLQSTIRADGTLHVALVDVPVPTPKDDEVLVRVEASPINPSDLGLLFGPADLSTLVVAGTRERPVVTARVPEAAMGSMKARVDQAMPVGNEGAGTVVAASSSPAAQALVGQRVAIIGGAMYAQYRAVPVESTLVIPDGATAVDGASSFVNPLTALGFVETMRREGHTAIVHTAAASNLGQMLQRICNEDGIALVNIVRKPEQRAILEQLGATWIVDSESPSFMADLTEAIAATGATLGFDATGGGRLASQILSGMEAALARRMTEYSRYGSPTHKQVYLYGGLDTRPTELVRNFGFSWGLGGWLLFPFLAKCGADTLARLKARVAASLTTTFASHYAKKVSLADALTAEAIAAYSPRTTGVKYLDRAAGVSGAFPRFHAIDGAPDPVAPFSHAVEASDGWVFVTGQMPFVDTALEAPYPDGNEAQTHAVMKNLVTVLAGCGLSLANVYSSRVFLTQFDRDYAGMNAVYASYFAEGRRPAHTCVGVTGLARGALVEIDFIARRERGAA